MEIHENVDDKAGRIEELCNNAQDIYFGIQEGKKGRPGPVIVYLTEDEVLLRNLRDIHGGDVHIRYRGRGSPHGTPVWQVLDWQAVRLGKEMLKVRWFRVTSKGQYCAEMVVEGSRILRSWSIEE